MIGGDGPAGREMNADVISPALIGTPGCSLGTALETLPINCSCDVVEPIVDHQPAATVRKHEAGHAVPADGSTYSAGAVDLVDVSTVGESIRWVCPPAR